MCPPVTDVLESTESIQEDVDWVSSGFARSYDGVWVAWSAAGDGNGPRVVWSTAGGENEAKGGHSARESSFRRRLVQKSPTRLQDLANALKAGGQHHHRTNFDKYHYGYFGKVGMRHFHKNKAALWRPVINVDRLASLIPEEQRKGLNADSTIVPVVDTLAAGYGKVLAKGRLPLYPIIIKARYVSRRAEEKIKAAGGVVTIIA